MTKTEAPAITAATYASATQTAKIQVWRGVGTWTIQITKTSVSGRRTFLRDFTAGSEVEARATANQWHATLNSQGFRLTRTS